MHTQDAWAVVFQLLWDGRKGLIDDTFTTGLRSSDGKKTGNMSRNYHFLVSSQSQHKDLAWAFLKWMNQGPEFRMQHLMTEDLGFAPSVKGQPMPSAFTAQMNAAFADSMSTPYQTYMPVVKGLADLEGILWQANSLLYTKAVSPDEYTKRLDADLNAAIKKAYS